MTNIRLTYEYTLNSIKTVSESVDKINTKLTVLLTLSGILVNFGKDLPGSSILINCISEYYPCPACYLLKFVAYACFIIAIAIGLRGLLTATTGKIILPEQLLNDEWNLIDEENYLTALILYLEKETLLELQYIRQKQAGRFDWASRFLGTAVILLCLDEMLGLSIPILGHFCLNLPH
ncbi:hypothetical protein [Spirulina sp. 06S082]|uniref:hypothetical protein n=1 Tax=Spirulina sp. 06S082 TaxID=3110248 RepID=UPI002B1E9857|nr:hypothetical protein [Spirulina sp. 06S082]MEA5471358.1 hypothetical protein [Spirulina sp. 06S082]